MILSHPCVSVKVKQIDDKEYVFVIYCDSAWNTVDTT